MGDINSSDGHNDLLFIDYDGSVITLNKSIPLRDENTTQGILCRDITNNDIKECIYQEASGIVRMYQINATVATDSTLNVDICEVSGEGGTPDGFSNGINDVIPGTLSDIPYADFDSDGSLDYFFVCKGSVVAIENDATITYNLTGIEGGAGSTAIYGVRLADLTVSGESEIIVLHQDVFGAGVGGCGVGTGFQSGLKVFDTATNSVFADDYDCSSTNQQHRTDQAIVHDVIGNDGKEEIIVFSSRGSLRVMHVYENWETTPDETITTNVDFFVNGADYFTLTPMPLSYTLNKPEYNLNNPNFFIINVNRVFDPYKNIQIYNFSNDFLDDSAFHDGPIPIIVDMHGGLLFSQDGNTGIFTGIQDFSTINIDETSETNGWHHYQQSQIEESNRYSTGITQTSGTHSSFATEKIRTISKGDDSSQHLIADLDNDSINELYIIDGSTLSASILSINTGR